MNLWGNLKVNNVGYFIFLDRYFLSVFCMYGIEFGIRVGWKNVVFIF